MPFRRRRLSRSRRGGSRKRTREWVHATTSPNLNFDEPGPLSLGIDSFAPQWIISPPDVEAFWDEPTVERLIIYFDVHLEIATASLGADLIASGWVGITTWKSDAAVPNEFIRVQDPRDYLWWYPFILGNTGAGQAITVVSKDNSTSGELFDMRGRRKMPQGTGLAFCIATSGINNADIWYTLGARILVSHA